MAIYVSMRDMRDIFLALAVFFQPFAEGHLISKDVACALIYHRTITTATNGVLTKWYTKIARINGKILRSILVYATKSLVCDHFISSHASVPYVIADNTYVCYSSCFLLVLILVLVLRLSFSSYSSGSHVFVRSLLQTQFFPNQHGVYILSSR